MFTLIKCLFMVIISRTKAIHFLSLMFTISSLVNLLFWRCIEHTWRPTNKKKISKKAFSSKI